MAAIFSIIESKRLQNDLHAFKKNVSVILFHSSSVVVLSEPMLDLFSFIKCPI